MFICGTCRHRFSSIEYREHDLPEREEHPYDYDADCPICGKLAKFNEIQLNLFKGLDATRHPRSGQALENIRKAAKLKDTSMSRFNALTHGLSARVARIFPAKEGKYAQCDACEYFNNGCGQVSTACLKRTELFLQVEIATETKNATMLNRLMSDNQAGLIAIQADMMAEVAQSGVVIHDPVHYVDKETGKTKLAMVINEKTGKEELLTEIREHPLLRRIIEFTQKNGQTLADMGLTARQQEEERTLKGFIEDRDDDSGAEARERQALFAQRQAVLFGRALDATEGIKSLGEPLIIDQDKNNNG